MAILSTSKVYRNVTGVGKYLSYVTKILKHNRLNKNKKLLMAALMGAKVEIKSVRTNSEERSLRILSNDKYIPKPLSCYGKLSTVLVRILPKITFLLGGGRAVAAHI